MAELFGDSSRGGEWATARLVVEGQRILAAEVPGLERELRGLTLLEAAAVGGETLAVDALANAIGPALRARPDRRRTAVAMSGGVDSAVALLAAGEHAGGVTLRLWIDPNATESERACCSPSAVIAARETCHGLGLPHVTLDLRERFRTAVVALPFCPRLRAWRDAEPVCALQRQLPLRRAAALAARRVGAHRLATGHDARIVERGGRLMIARAADAAKDQSYMLATLDPAVLGRLWFPLADQSKPAGDPRPGRRRRARSRDAHAESQEACFLGGADYRAFLGRQGLAHAPGRSSTSRGRDASAPHEGFWRYTAGQRRGLGIAAAEPLYAVATVPASNTVIVGPRSSFARSRVKVRGRLDGAGGRVGQAWSSLPAVAATVTVNPGGFELLLDDPAYGVAPGQTAVLYSNDAVVGAQVIVSATER